MIRTYGCQMNERDSESISWILSKEGFVETNNMEDADIVIFNTCAVRQNAENKLIGNLGDLKHTMETKNLEKIIMVCGCVMEIDSSRQFLEDKFKHVDIIFGTNSIAILEDLLEEHLSTKKQVVNIDSINLKTRETIGKIENIISNLMSILCMVAIIFVHIALYHTQEAGRYQETQKI